MNEGNGTASPALRSTRRMFMPGLTSAALRLCARHRLGSAVFCGVGNGESDNNKRLLLAQSRRGAEIMGAGRSGLAMK
jgi:hypothetical protein